MSFLCRYTECSIFCQFFWNYPDFLYAGIDLWNSLMTSIYDSVINIFNIQLYDLWSRIIFMDLLLFFQVVLEGLWQQGYMALAAIGATNIGSIQLFIEPELKTNKPRKKFLYSEPPEERIYKPEGVGNMLYKGDELAAFNMGSTVVLVFQAPISKLLEEGCPSPEFNFSVRRGDRVRVGEALGRWN